MRRIDLTFRIIKVGGKAVSVAICAMTGMMFMSGSAMATIIPTGASTGGVQDIGGNPLFDIQSASIDALGVTTNTWSNTSGSSLTVYSNTITLQSGNKITGKTLADGSTYAAVYSQNTIAAGPFYNYTSLASATFNVQGNNIVNGAVGLNFTNWSGYGTNVDPLAVVNLNGYNVTFGNAVYAANTYINAGTNNTVNNDFSFYGTLNSNLTFNQAASVLLNGGLSGGNLNFNGYNSYVTLGANQSITGNVTTSGVNGVLIFQGAGNVNGTVGSTSSTLKEVRTNGTGNVLFNSNAQQAYVDYVNYQAATLVGFNGGLNLTVDGSSQAKNQVAFNNNDGVLQINNGNLTSKAGTVVVSTTGNNLGTVTMVSGTQAITGGIGASGHAIKTLNIGGNSTGGLDASSANYSTTTANGDIYAQNINLNNNGATNSSSLTMASGYNLTGTVGSDTNHSGILTLAGGTQTVTGTVGVNNGNGLSLVNSGANGANSTFTADVVSNTVTNTGTGTSNFNTNVTATNINVNSGISNFTNNVAATTTTIGTGVGNFNTNGTGTTSSNLVFSDAGTANLYTGLTGNIDMGNKAATVNVSAGKTITGSATSTGGTNGTLNFLGAGRITSNIGTSITTGVATVNVNSVGSTSGALVEADGNVYAGVVNLAHAGILQLATAGTVLTGTTATALTGTQQVVTTDVNNTGTLTLTGATHTVTGQIGANNMALATVNAGDAASTDTFNNMVYATKLNVGAGGTVVLNGQSGLQAGGLVQGDQTNSAIAGIKGTVDFLANGNASTLRIGNTVNLTTGAAGIQFANANGSTLTFDGSSTVAGVVGGNTAGNSTFNAINAGAAGKLVTFSNDVAVGTGNLNVSGTGQVVLNGNLNGALNYNADGTVNVANGKSISGVVTTAATNTGTLNFLGGTTLNADIGTSGLMLKAVNFNTATNNVTQAINHNVYATDMTIGSNAGSTATSLQDATGVYDYAGATQMSIFTGGTTANISNVGNTGAIAIGGNLNIANATTAVNFGVAHVNVAGNVITHGGAMSYTVNTNDFSANNAISTSSGSGQVAATGTLTMTGAEKVQINYVGSLKQNGTYNVITAASNTGYVGTLANVTDNSFAIDTTVKTNALNGNLTVTADRSGGGAYAINQDYANKSGTVGNFSNNAAAVIAGLAAAGTQTGDMVQVIQKLEINSFGYGNTASNLATQVKRLAPVANASLSQASFGATNLTTSTIDGRMSSLRGDNLASADGTGISAGDAAKSNAFWLKGYGSMANQNASGQYDGYKFNTGGLAMGADTRLNADGLIGLAISDASTKVDQQGFRLGDSTTIKSVQLTGYGSYNLSRELYIDGSLSYTGNKHNGNRATAVGRTAQASYNGNQLMARLGAGYRIALEGKTVFTPLVSVESSHLNTNAYTETGAGALNLAVGSQSLNRSRLGLGGRLSTEAESNGTIYRPELSAMLFHDAGALTKDTTATFTGGGASFTTPGADAVRNTVDIGAGVAITTGKDSSVLVQYDYATHSGYHAQTVQATGRWAF